MKQYDLIIIGGGLVGGTLACALAGSGLRVAVVEAVAPALRAEPSYDERVIALSWGSRLILAGAGLWDEVRAQASPIEHIHISDRGHPGFAHLDRQDLGVEALGYVVPARLLMAAIDGCLSRTRGIEMLAPARVVGMRIDADGADVEVAAAGTSSVMRTRLLVAADGGDSTVRRRLGLVARERAYGHDAVISTVTVDRPRAGVAFERFTETGPLAMLPMTEGRYSVVWTVCERDVDEVLRLSDQAFIERLQGRFGWRLGSLSRPGRRVAYPLKLLVTPNPVRPRLVLIGNAAHTLHPVAGQGLNLGLRDVAALAQVVADAAAAGADPGAAPVLDAYRRLRGRDQADIALITDGLARLFVNPWLPLRMVRGLGMLGLDLVPGTRRLAARRFMGLSGSLPRLARGLPPGAHP